MSSLNSFANRDGSEAKEVLVLHVAEGEKRKRDQGLANEVGDDDELEGVDEDLRKHIKAQLLSPQPVFASGCGRTALHRAAERGLGRVVSQLLTVCSSLIDARDKKEGATALHDAADKGHVAIVEQLLDMSPNLAHVMRVDGSTALHCAARNGHTAVVTQLLVMNPSLASTRTRGGGWTALHSAAAANRGEVVTQLLSLNSHVLVGARTSSGWTALHFAVETGNEALVAQLLAADPASIHAATDEGWTPLHNAALLGTAGVVAQLLASRPAPSLLLRRSARSQSGIAGGATALHLAARRNNSEVVAQLLAACPDLVDVLDDDNQTCLHYAAHESIVTCLTNFKPALIHAVDANGNTILHSMLLRTSGGGSIERVWRINPAALHKVNRDGKTPFDFAVATRQGLDLWQWRVTVDDIVSAHRKCSKSYVGRFKPLMALQCEELVGLLIPDVVAMVFEYLNF